MITLKSPHEIELMRRAGKITAAARALARDMVKPGVTTAQIDKAVFQFIKEQGATPSFLHYNGYPASVCVSVNDEIIHGIPGKRVLQEGDIVSVDVGAFIGGFHGDCAGTYPCGQVSDEALRLIRVTPAIRQMPDGWTVRTADGKNAAHYENTVLITDGEPELLTDPEKSLV